VVKSKVQDKRDGGKGSESKPPLQMRSADQILKEVKDDPGMRRIMQFMKGAKIEPEDIFSGDYLKGDEPPKDTTGYKLK
jgi:hypothetical protein